jgi:beta-lactamase regulating signal transducer with metallopeptidase domain
VSPADLAAASWPAVAGATAVIALWHTSVLALLLEAWLATSAAPARRQYAVAAAALATGVVLTAATPFVLARQPAAGADAPFAAAGPAQAGKAAGLPTGAAAPRAIAAAAAPVSGPAARLASLVVPWLGAMAVAGALLSFLRVAGGWALAHWIRRRAVVVQSPRIAHAMADVRAASGLPDAALLASAHVDAPVVIGVRAPAILLPPDLERHLAADALPALLAHELAHVRRADYAANLAQSVADALLWFSPGARWISRRIREAREYCCDDVAADRCGAARYAAALATLAGLGAVSAARPALNAVGPRLIVRIRRLLKEDAMRPLARYRLAGLIASSGLAAAAGAAVIPVSAAGVAQATASADLAEWPVPYGFVMGQKGAAVVLRDVTPTLSSMCGSALVENRGSVAVAALRFVAFAMPRRGSHEPDPQAMRISEWLPAAVAPGTTASIDVGLMSRDDTRRLGGPDAQVKCAVTEIRYANGAAWRSSPLVVFAPSPAEIPRALVGAPAASDTPICQDDAGENYSPGAVVRIALEPGSLARCEAGQWVEYRMPLGPFSADKSQH